MHLYKNKNKERRIMENMNQGLQGLGNININNASATIENTGLIMDKLDSDSRKIAVSNTMFNSAEAYYTYFVNYMQNTGLLKVSDVHGMVRQTLNYNNLFIVEKISSGEAFTIFTVFPENDILNIINALQLLPQHPEIQLPVRKVAISHSNFTREVINEAKHLNLELLGYNAIYDINNAILSADNKIPYANISASSFASQLAKGLNTKYRSESSTNITQQLGDQAQSIKNNLGTSFSDGISQLKESITSLTSAMGINRNKAQQQMPMQGQGQRQGMPSVQQYTLELEQNIQQGSTVTQQNQQVEIQPDAPTADLAKH